MKTHIPSLLVLLLLFLNSCKTSECPPDPLSNEDVAGYIDASTGILFTTAADKLDVLASLQAESHEGLSYRMPIYELGDQMVYLVFEVSEVEKPFQYIDFQYADYCYGSLFQEFENELMDLIDMNEENLTDQFIIACGDALGKLGEKENGKEKNVKGKEKESLEKLGEKKQAKKILKNELADKARQKGEEAKAKLNNDDKEGAKEKGKELVKETKEKFYLDYNYDYCDEWKLKLEFGYFWTEKEPVIPPDLINEFTNANIRYKVYKNAECGPGPPTLSFICNKSTAFWMDTLRPEPPAVWTTQNHLPRDVCQRGADFCVEQEVVVLIEYDYSDSLCKKLVAVRPYSDFACFK